MTYFENPFTPSFGEIPAHLAGRKEIVEAIERALQSTQRRPDLTTVFSGARGTGKTTLLSLIASKAEQLGWISVCVTALPQMLTDIEVQLHRKARHLLSGTSNPRITEIGVPQVLSVAIDSSGAPLDNWRSRMSDMLDELNEQGVGVLITVDEVDVELDEMVELTAVYQHFVRENRKVGLLMAGLPHNISSLLNNKSVSFLRRAQMAKLDRIPDYEVEIALEKTIVENGRTIAPHNLTTAVKAIDGFAFMMQLVGFRAWDVNPDTVEITDHDIERGVYLAKKELCSRILDATYYELSDTDIRFLAAMLEDEGDSRIADIAQRLNRSSSQVAQYRKRLIDAGVIGMRSRGVIGFDLPFFKEYLTEKLKDEG